MRELGQSASNKVLMLDDVGTWNVLLRVCLGVSIVVEILRETLLDVMLLRLDF